MSTLSLSSGFCLWRLHVLLKKDNQESCLLEKSKRNCEKCELVQSWCNRHSQYNTLECCTNNQTNQPRITDKPKTTKQQHQLTAENCESCEEKHQIKSHMTSPSTGKGLRFHNPLLKQDFESKCLDNIPQDANHLSADIIQRSIETFFDTAFHFFRGKLKGESQQINATLWWC